MNTTRNICLVIAFLVLGGAVLIAARAAKPGTPDITFAHEDYFHRWSKDDQHEFTPQGQEDLDHWSDMITINYYRNAKDGDALASNANAVIQNYRNSKAMILKTSSVPRTATKPAEHFCAALFTQPDFIEAAFARFALVNGTGASVVYSHREYGKGVGNQMSEWLKKNGPPAELTLMSMDNIPRPDDFKK